MIIDRTGLRQLSGVGWGKARSDGDDVACLIFTLDGKHYAAIENSSDGYRSYCEDIVQVDTPPDYTFPPRWVSVFLGDGDFLFITNPQTGNTILKVGTEDPDDYYPLCVMEYFPENIPAEPNNEPNYLGSPKHRARRDIAPPTGH